MRDAAYPGLSAWALTAITRVPVRDKLGDSRHTQRTADEKAEAEIGVTRPHANKLQGLLGGHQKHAEARSEFPGPSEEAQPCQRLDLGLLAPRAVRK